MKLLCATTLMCAAIVIADCALTFEPLRGTNGGAAFAQRYCPNGRC